MFAHRLIVILVIIALCYVFYRVAMYYLKKSKRFSAAFREEQRQTLKTRLDELYLKQDELSDLQQSVEAAEELRTIHKEIDLLTKQLAKLETKRGKK